MAVTNEQLVAVLGADIRKLEKAMDKAYGKTDRTFTRIEHRGKKMEKTLSQIGRGFNLSKFLGPAAVAGASRAFQVFADSATRIENSLKVAGLAGADLERVYDRLEDSAKRNYAPFETLVDLYSKSALAQKELKVTSEELIKFTDNVAVALRVNGKSASESRGALIQLSQAMGSGTVRAEEFNAILEGARPIAQAAAAGLKEAGGSVAKLRTLVIEGKVSSEAFFRAFEAGAVILKDKVAEAGETSAQAMETLKTKLTTAARKMNDAVPIMSVFIGVLASVGNMAEFAGRQIERYGDSWNSIGNRKLVGPLREELAVIRASRDALLDRNEALKPTGVFTTLGSGTGLYDTPDFIEKIDRNKKKITEYNKQIELVQRRIFELGNGGRKPGEKPVTDVTVTVTPVSTGDFDTPGGAGKGKKSPTQKFSKDVDQIKARTLAIQAETAAMQGLNPLINDYGYALTKAAAVQDLLNEAQRAGVKITPALRGNIDQLAEGLANATVQASRLEEEQGKLVDRAHEFSSLGENVLGGFIRDVRDGTNATEALGSSLSKIADKLLDMAVQNLFTNALGGGSSGGAGGNFLAALFGSVPNYANGTNNHPGGLAVVGENGRELVSMPKGSQVIANHKLSNNQSGSMHITVGFSSDNGGLAPFVEEIAQRESVSAIGSYDRNVLPERVIGSMRKFNRGGNDL